MTTPHVTLALAALFLASSVPARAQTPPVPPPPVTPPAAPSAPTVGAAVPKSPDPSPLFGRWAINRGLSDDPGAVIDREVAAASAQQGSGFQVEVNAEPRDRIWRVPGGETGPDGKPRRKTASPPTEAERRAIDRVRELLTTAPETIAIKEKDGRIEIIGAVGGTLKWTLDDEPHTDEALGPGIATRARWDGRKLTGQSEIGGGITLVQAFTIVAGEGGAQRLQARATIKRERAGSTILVQRLYEIAK